MNVRRRNTLEKWLRDYIVPIIWLLLVVILIFNAFSWDTVPESNTQVENKIWLSIELWWNNSESFISYPWDHKEKIVWDTMLYKWEKIIIKEGTASLNLASVWDFKVNKLWELKYLENGDFSLFSSDLWLNSKNQVTVDMRFASVKVWENTHISFSQNEMGSTIYLVNWFAEVSNKVWQNTVLASGQKITISRLDASKEELDLSLLKSNIDDYYKQSDWFIINNWISYLNLDEKKEEDTEKTSTWKTTSITTTWLLSLSNLYDEANVSSDVITVSWTFNNEDIEKILLNWKEAIINKELKTFKFEKIKVPNRENDFVFKVYDDANDLLSKFVYVIYYDWWKIKDALSNKFNVQTFDVDGSQFTFTTIKDWVSKQLNGKTSYTTYGDFLTIYWNVTAKWIKRVDVDWYTLKSFKWNTWRYHPSVINNNLNIWTNVYEIKYFDTEDNLVYTNHFTIIKKTTKKESTKTISDEAKIN